MIAIQFKFPTGKLHATPWGRQVNEGAVEWPPSPWRILRALLSVWHQKFPDVEESQMKAIINAMSGLPSFHLPPASQGHTRHYVPTAKNPALVFDTFVVVPKDRAVVALWPTAALSDDQQELLSRLLSAMTYFGRAESWVEAALITEQPEELNAVPMTETGVASDQSLERVLAAENESVFEAWRTEAIGERLSEAIDAKRRKAEAKGKSVDKVKLTAKETQKIEDRIPSSIFAALHADTSDLRKAGWNRPPGSRVVSYVRPESAFESLPRSRRVLSAEPYPIVARYAVAGTVVPRLTKALRISERARTFLMGCSKRINAQAGFEESASVVFSGKSPDGHRMEGAHQHAHFLCEASGQNSRITHLNIYAPMGFTPADEQALARFTRTWGDEGHDLQFVLLGIGHPADFGGFNSRAGQSALLATSKKWISRTPFVPARHLKIKASERHDPSVFKAAHARELEANIRRELSSRAELKEFAKQVDVKVDGEETVATQLGSKRVRWLEFIRERKNGRGSRGSSHGFGIVLNFPEPVCGPIALGYGCHFGLGQFVAVRDSKAELKE